VRAVASIIACALVAILAVTLALPSAQAGEKDGAAAEAKRVQQQMREMERQAEASRREAEKAAKRMEREARQQQREAEQRQRQAEQQAKAAQRAEQANARRAQSDSAAKSSTENQKASSSSSSNTTKASTESKATPAEKTKESNGDAEKTSKAKTDAKADKAEAKKIVEIDEPPPPTVQKWLQKLVGQDDAKDDAKAGTATAEREKSDETILPPVGSQKAATPANTVATEAAKPSMQQKSTAKPAPGGRPDPIVFPEFAPEVLAVNTSKHALEQAKALGFTQSTTTSLASLDLSITRLRPPPGMSSADAQALLKQKLPTGSFAPNHKYRIYKTAGGSHAHPAGARAATIGAAANQGCDGERCFGRTTIGWQPQLRNCASGLKIGIIDTSVDIKHPTLATKRIDIKHLGRDGAPGPDWHGTGVTALLAGDAGSGTPGLIPDAAFFVADIFTADADNEPASDTVSMLRAFDWLEHKGVKIINMSLSGPPDELVRKATEKLASKGILLVAAAGNEGPAAGPSYPAAYDNVIAVTAVTKDLQSYRYANRGSYIDLAAPGVSIWTAFPGAMEGFHSGTSFATPYVTATLAALYPQLAVKSHGEVLRTISYRDLGAPGPDPIFGQGLIVAPSSCSPGDAPQTPRTFESVATTKPNDNPAPVSRSLSPAGEHLPWLSLGE
jgi:Subtilase family